MATLYDHDLRVMTAPKDYKLPVDLDIFQLNKEFEALPIRDQHMESYKEEEYYGPPVIKNSHTPSTNMT